MSADGYRGRLAPSPTGLLHLGHARTFWVAQQRARRTGGRLVLRMDDLDGPRCREEFVRAAYEDLQWLGVDWDEGPDVGGEFGPYTQSKRGSTYRKALLKLVRQGHVYPCYCSRKDIESAASAPHAGEDELIYPGTCRPADSCPIEVADWTDFERRLNPPRNGRQPCWRYRTNAGRRVGFDDLRFGRREYVCGDSFGDFVVWRRDDTSSYQLACVVDDSDMNISEVVRGEDLLASTARQILLGESLGSSQGKWCHCDLLRDETGERLAKRHDALSLRLLRAEGVDPRAWIETWKVEFRALLA